MHPDDHPVAPRLARALIAGALPDLAHLPLRRVFGGGTDNVLYRVGHALVARFPRRAGAAEEIGRLETWLPGLAGALPLPVPLIRHRCGAALGYPFGWTVADWLPGRDAFAAPPDKMRAAAELAAFLARLQGLDVPEGAPGRGPSDDIRAILAGLPPFLDGFRHEADPAQLKAMIARAADAPAFAGRTVWVHGDLHPLNLLTRRGRLAAVIDWGGMGVGDPGMDLMPAWTLFDAPARLAFRRALNPDPGAWARGRALALAKAVMAIPYYRTSNPVFHAVMCRTLAQVLEDPPG